MLLGTRVINAYAQKLHAMPLRDQMISVDRLSAYSNDPQAFRKALCDRLMVLHYYQRIMTAISRYDVMQEMMSTIDREIAEVVLEALIKGL